MTRFLLLVLASISVSAAQAAEDTFSFHCTDQTGQKVTLMMTQTDRSFAIAAFAADEEGWPMVVNYQVATPERLGTLNLPEGAQMFVGASPDEAGTGIERYLLLPQEIAGTKFTAFFGSYYSDEPIVLEEKTSMECM